MLEPKDIFERLQEKFEGVTMTLEDSHAGDPFITIPADEVVSILSFLRDEAAFSFNSLMNITGVDYPPDSIAIVYHLHSLIHRHKVTIKAFVPRDGGELHTVSHLWDIANWFEREIYDLLGTRFTNHPQMNRLLLPRDWVGHPLRKDYQEAPEYNGIPTKRETTVGSERKSE